MYAAFGTVFMKLGLARQRHMLQLQRRHDNRDRALGTVHVGTAP